MQENHNLDINSLCGCIDNEEALIKNAQSIVSCFKGTRPDTEDIKTRIRLFYDNYPVLKKLLSEITKTLKEHHPELYRVTEELSDLEHSLFVALQPSLSEHVQKYKNLLQQYVDMLKFLKSKQPEYIMWNTVILRDKIIKINRKFVLWFPRCLQPPVDTFPYEGEPLVSDRTEGKRWFCIARMLHYLPKETTLIFNDRPINIFDLGVEIGYLTNALLLKLPSLEFEAAMPRNPIVNSQLSVREQPECCVCGECKSTIVDTSKLPGHETCGRRNTVCYDCFRSYAWNLQHNGRREFAVPRSVPCPLCRYKFPLRSEGQNTRYELDKRMEIRRLKRRLRGPSRQTAKA